MSRMGERIIVWLIIIPLVFSITPFLFAEPDTQKDEDSQNTFVARKVEKDNKANEEPNYMLQDGKVIPNPKKLKRESDTTAESVEKQPMPAASNLEEPNYISVDGKVIRNPKKLNLVATNSQDQVNPVPQTPSLHEEPNYISVNGQVIKNPNKKEIN